MTLSVRAPTLPSRGTHLKVTQYGRNWSTNKLVAGVKYLCFIATSLAVDLQVGQARLTQEVMSLVATNHRFR